MIHAYRSQTRNKTLKITGWILLGLAILLIMGWASLAIYYSDLPESLRLGAAIAYGLVSLLLILFIRPFRWAVMAFLVFFSLILIWWLNIPPSNDRDWQPDVAVLPYAIFDGNMVTIHNIRNCGYRTETDYTVRYYDRTFDLGKLKTADLFLVYWGSPYIAHTMISFGFDGGNYVCFSIETRKEIGEDYSSIKGFFKQYEITYVIADERDLVRLRTNYRHENVYLYQLNIKPDFIRKVFLDYLRQVNRLREKPEWYNALTENCTTAIRARVRPYNPNAKFDWRIIVNGFVDQFIYEQKTLSQKLPFAELKAKSYVNLRGQAADKDPEFSLRIREGLPGF
ncbi:MAG: DUF4105 domain-containing protein [Syntrophaceae bacterium]|nr:DUF4105 domain-containing protein [Syntrophaceae bacterium]